MQTDFSVQSKVLKQHHKAINDIVSNYNSLEVKNKANEITANVLSNTTRAMGKLIDFKTRNLILIVPSKKYRLPATQSMR
jgi:hypothetical protein